MVEAMSRYALQVEAVVVGTASRLPRRSKIPSHEERSQVGGGNRRERGYH